MAFRIGDYVARGEIRNTRRNSVTGWLEVLRRERHRDGTETIEPSLVLLSVTGNLSGELDGRNFRFAVRERDIPSPRPILEPSFHNDQIGAMGDSVFRLVRVPLIPLEEFFEVCRRGESPPEEQRVSIYLEWYSQNGRVVLELLDPILEFEGGYQHLADPEPEPVPPAEDSGQPQITTIERNEDGSFTIHDDSAAQFEEVEDDPFHLFPEQFDSEIRRSAFGGDSPRDLSESAVSEDEAESADRQSGDVSNSRRSWDEIIPGIDPETKAMYEQWDEVIDGSKDEPLTWLFEEPLCLPRPEHLLDEDHAWTSLLTLLTAMALRGVAFDMCPHYSATQAYRLLLEELLPEAGVHPNLVATGFVCHFSSWEHCPECDAETEGNG